MQKLEPITLEQLPVKTSFAVTINNAQRQPVKYDGVELTEVFFNGQLHVAKSRSDCGENHILY